MSYLLIDFFPFKTKSYSLSPQNRDETGISEMNDNLEFVT